MHPMALSVREYLSRAARVWLAHGFPSLRPLQPPSVVASTTVSYRVTLVFREDIPLETSQSRRAMRSRQDTSQQGDVFPSQQLGLFGSSAFEGSSEQHPLLQSDSAASNAEGEALSPQQLEFLSTLFDAAGAEQHLLEALSADFVQGASFSALASQQLTLVVSQAFEAFTWA